MIFCFLKETVLWWLGKRKDLLNRDSTEKDWRSAGPAARARPAAWPACPHMHTVGQLSSRLSSHYQSRDKISFFTARTTPCPPAVRRTPCSELAAQKLTAHCPVTLRPHLVSRADYPRALIPLGGISMPSPTPRGDYHASLVNKGEGWRSRPESVNKIVIFRNHENDSVSLQKHHRNSEVIKIYVYFLEKKKNQE